SSETTRLDRANTQSAGPASQQDLNHVVPVCAAHPKCRVAVPLLRLTSPVSSHTRADRAARQDGIVTFDYGLKLAIVRTCCLYGQTLRKNRRKGSRVRNRFINLPV